MPNVLPGKTPEDDVTVNLFSENVFLIQKDKLDGDTIDITIELSNEQAKQLVKLIQDHLKLPTVDNTIETISRSAFMAHIPKNADGKWLNRWVKNFK